MSHRNSPAAASIERQVALLLADYLEPRWAEDPTARIEISAETRLASDLTLDSFQVMEFLMQVEDALDVAIDMTLLADVRTVRDLAGVVAERLGPN